MPDGIIVHLYRERIYIIAPPAFISARLCLVKGESLTMGMKRLNVDDNTGVLVLGAVFFCLESCSNDKAGWSHYC